MPHVSDTTHPIHRGFGFTVSQVDRALIQKLADLAFTQDARNVVPVGDPGTGKTHLATALGIAGLTRHAKRVRFYSTVDLCTTAGSACSDSHNRSLLCARPSLQHRCERHAA